MIIFQNSSSSLLFALTLTSFSLILILSKDIKAMNTAFTATNPPMTPYSVYNQIFQGDIAQEMCAPGAIPCIILEFALL